MNKFLQTIIVSFLCPLFMEAAPEDAFLKMVSDKEVHVVDASKITDPAVTHQSVIERAIERLPHGKSQADLGGHLVRGQWDNGTVVFGQGPYILTDEIIVPARVNLIGTIGSHRPNQAGTHFKVEKGGDLSGASADSKYVFRTAKSDGRNYNGSFNQHWENFGIDGGGFCRGLLVAGAQCSSIKKVGVINCKDVAIFIAGGRPLLLQDVEAGGMKASSLPDSIVVLCEGERVQILNCSFGDSDIGLKVHGMGTVTISGIVFEGIKKVALVKTSVLGILTGDGISIQGARKLSTPYGAGAKGDCVLLKSPPESTIILSGTFRNASGPKIWDLGGVRHVIKGATSNANKQFPFIISDDGLASVLKK